MIIFSHCVSVLLKRRPFCFVWLLCFVNTNNSNSRDYFVNTNNSNSRDYFVPQNTNYTRDHFVLPGIPILPTYLLNEIEDIVTRHTPTISNGPNVIAK